MTYGEAKMKAIAAGFAEPIPASVLAFFGYEAPAPTAGVQTGAVIVPENVKQDLAALQAEAEANRLPQQIAGNVISVLGWAKTAGLLCVALLLIVLAGCSSRQASHSLEQASIAVQALNDQHSAFEETFISYYRTTETARVQELYDKAIRDVTRIEKVAVQKPIMVRLIKPDGTTEEKQEMQNVTEEKQVIDLAASEALMKHKIELLTGIEARVRDMRAQQAGICANYATFKAYSDGLRAYFSQKQVSYESLKASQDQLLEFLKTFVKPRVETSALPKKL